MTNQLFLAQFSNWIARDAPDRRGRSPAPAPARWPPRCRCGSGPSNHLQKAKDADGDALYQGSARASRFPLADALCWLLAARSLILDVLELEEKGPENPVVAEGLEGTLDFYTDLCHVQAARAAGEVGRVCAELVYGYNRHPAWDDEAACACYDSEELDVLEGVIPGMAAARRGPGRRDSRRPAPPCKAGPCVRPEGIEAFIRLRIKLDGCLTGARLAKDRAAQALTGVMIPEALDYPL